MSELNFYADLPVATAAQCRFQGYEEEDGDYLLNVVAVNCPKYADTVIELSITDTLANWDLTHDHCANVLFETSDSFQEGGVWKETRTYALWAGAGINTITHYRPKDSPMPAAHSGGKISSFTMPTDYAGATCAQNGGDDSGDGDSNGGSSLQSDLDVWADEYPIGAPKACYLDTTTVTPEVSNGETAQWKYLMYSGGCDT